MATKTKSKAWFWGDKELEFLKENYGYLTNKEISDALGFSENTIRRRIKEHKVKKVAQREYTIYKGDEILMTGNREECISFLGISNKLFTHYKTPYYKKRVEKANNGIYIVDIGMWRID